MKNFRITFTKENEAKLKEKEAADKIRRDIAERKHTEKMKESDLELEGIQHNLDTLKAIRKNNLIELLMKPFTKTKKLSKSFFRKAIHIGHNIFWVLLLAVLIGCGEDNPVTTDAQLVGDLDSIYVQNINDSGDTARAEIHLNRLVKSVRVTFDLQTNASNNNMPAILIKFGIAQQTIITLSPSNALILNNSMLDSDVFFTVSVKSLNNVFVFLKLKNIKVYLN